MLEPASGPFLFDTSAESWLARSHDPAVRDWFREYLSLHPLHVSAVTVVERIRGYALLHAPPVIERSDRDVVLLAILPPRHPRLGVAFDDAADFLLACHAAIFDTFNRSINTGSSDAYDGPG